MLSFFRKTEEKERKKSFLVNGSALLDEIIVSFKGRHNIPIRSFTAEELFQATDGFKNRFHWTASGGMFKASFEQRPIVVLYDNLQISTRFHISEAIHNMVITSQMSHHKNVLRLLGCCLEYKVPALVYEYSGTELLSHKLYNEEGVRTDRLLSWNTRLNIAKDIASVVAYLHTAFPTPIVHRDIHAANVIIDQFGVAKLFDFSLCISLPPGESQVVDVVAGKMGCIEPEYFLTGIVTEKIDTFYFGMFLVQLLTARKSYYYYYEKEMFSVDYFRNCIENGSKLYEILDPAILGDGGGAAEQDQQIEAFVALALKCLQDKREDRPDMIDVAKELRRIEKSIDSSSLTPSNY